MRRNYHIVRALRFGSRRGDPLTMCEPTVSAKSRHGTWATSRLQEPALSEAEGCR